MVTTVEVWDEFMNRPSIECLDIFKNEYRRSGELGDLRNLNMVLMDVGEWQKAKDNCLKIINEEEDSCDDDFIVMGMLEWFMGNTTTAVNLWRQAREAKYADSVGAIDGPIVLWYAGRRLNDEKLIRYSLKKLKKFWKITDYRKIVKWPGTQAIAGFILGEVPVDDFLVKWKWEALEHRRPCRANFWVGMTLLERDEEQAIKHFKAAFSADKHAILEYEYFLAKWEYARLTGQNVWNE